MKDIVPGCYKLQEVNSSFVMKELTSMKSTKSTGLDNIGPKFLKDGAKEIAYIITYLINLSINTKIVPECTKRSKVVPLYKKKSKLEVGNYRPVSVLTSISKILEKAIHIQVEEHCVNKGITYPLQSGFRHSYSTDTCLVYLHDYIRTAWSKGEFVGMVLLDVQKAFDSVDHQMLCEKISLIGIDPTWFESYLCNRKQVVCINNNMSSEQIIKCGVPQGSILGPWCYLVYSNDIATSVNCKLLMYADDTVLLVADKNVNTISEKLSNAVSSCSQWLINNKLSMHMGKTEAIIFSSKRKRHMTKNFVINCQGHTIKPTESVKYLGLHLEQHLSSDITIKLIVKNVILN